MSIINPTINYPRFLRVGHYEFMWELHASPLSFRDWLKPSSLRDARGDWLAWCGPLAVALCRAVRAALPPGGAPARAIPENRNSQQTCALPVTDPLLSDSD